MTTARIIGGTRNDGVAGLFIYYIENGKAITSFVKGKYRMSGCRQTAVNFILQKGYNANQTEIAKFITGYTQELILFHK